MKRRDFLKAAGAAGATLLLPSSPTLALGRKPSKNSDLATDKFPKRTLGKTGRRVSIIAFGGLALAGVAQSEADSAIAAAIENGIDYFDVAPTYGDAELKMGPALRPFRDNVFLACKTNKRDKKGAEQELHRSLEHLQTDHFDLYQLHAITNPERDVKAALAKGGAMEAILEARKSGLIKYIGFSAHSVEAALTAMAEFDFDTAMFPINFVCHYQTGFEDPILAEANRQNLGIIALKAMAKQHWPQNPDKEPCPRCWYEPITEQALISKALSWTLSRPGVCVAAPPSDLELIRKAIAAAPSCKEPSEQELAELEGIAAECKAIFG